MNQAVIKNEVVIKDISREPRVGSQKALREVTHTIALIPPNYIHTLWDDVEKHLAPAIARSHGRWDMQSLYESMRKMEQNLWVAFNDDNVVEGVGTTEDDQAPKEWLVRTRMVGLWDRAAGQVAHARVKVRVTRLSLRRLSIGNRLFENVPWTRPR